jgi:hypothetical protein
VPLRSPNEKGIRREWFRRFSIGEFPPPGGVNKQGDAAGIAPNEQRNVENGRYRENGIINRGGQTKWSGTPFTGKVNGIVGFGAADGAPNPRNSSDTMAPDTVDDDGEPVRQELAGSLYPRLFMIHHVQNYVLDTDVSPSWQKYPTAPTGGGGDVTGAAYGGTILIGGSDPGDASSGDVVLRAIPPTALQPGATFLGAAQSPRPRIRFTDPGGIGNTSIVISFITARGLLYFTLYRPTNNNVYLFSWDGTTLKTERIVDAGLHFWPVLFRFGDSIGWASAGSSQGGSDIVNFAQVRDIDGNWTTLPFDGGIASMRCFTAASELYLGGYDAFGNGVIVKWDSANNKFVTDHTIGGFSNIKKLLLGPDNVLYYLHGFLTSGTPAMQLGGLSAGTYTDGIKNISAQFPADGTLMPEDMVAFRDRMYVLARNAINEGFLYSGPMANLGGSWTREATWTPYVMPLGGAVNQTTPLNRLVVF